MYNFHLLLISFLLVLGYTGCETRLDSQVASSGINTSQPSDIDHDTPPKLKPVFSLQEQSNWICSNHPKMHLATSDEKKREFTDKCRCVEWFVPKVDDDGIVIDPIDRSAIADSTVNYKDPAFCKGAPED